MSIANDNYSQLEVSMFNIGGKASGALVGLFILADQTSAAAQEKQPVSIGEYCELQSTENPAEVHRDYTPFRDPYVDVPVESDVHGNITLTDFNCQTLVPVCETRGFASTKGTLSSVHAGLGRYNSTDDPAVAEAIRLLGRNSEIITIEFAQSSGSVSHLGKSHGLELYKSNDIGPVTQQLYGACAARLIRE